MSMKEWLAQVHAWRTQYKVVPERAGVDLTKVRVCCFVCGRNRVSMHRHHTGNDMMFARMLPDHFAANYVQFKRTDIELLCNYHHKRAHAIYKPLLLEFWGELNKSGTKIITPEWCEAWRQKFKTRFYEWAQHYKPRRKRGKRKNNRRRTLIRPNWAKGRRTDKE